MFTIKQITLLEYSFPKYFSTKCLYVYFEANVKEVNIVEEIKEEIKAYL